MPRDLVITTPVAPAIEARLRARVSDLRGLSRQALDLTVDLAGAQPGEVTVTLRPQAINVPDEIEVTSIDPKTLTFRIERVRRRAVSVRPFLVGDVPAGYKVGTPTASPEQVLVAGPESQIRRISEVTTERVILTGRTETFAQSVPVVSDSPLIRIVEPFTTLVTVPVLAEFGPNPPVAPDVQAAPTKRNP